jgi:aminoglycoside phosphotransferase (APT) family kinase protein
MRSADVVDEAEVSAEGRVPGVPDAGALADQPGEVRSEDAFDAARVARWLRANATDAWGLTGTPEVRQFRGGASNLTYLLRFGERDLILRRPPIGTKAKGAHDLAREHDLQAALAPVFPSVPTMVALCTDEDVLGATFYVMERVSGLILRSDPPEGLDLDSGLAAGLAQSAIETIVALHSVDPRAKGLAPFGRGPGYVSRQVGGWSQRFRRAHTPDVGDFEAVMSWLDDRQPADRGSVVIHNDFRFDNLVLDPEDPTHVRAVLDWELATIGDPLMDLGSSLAYWVQADDDAPMQSFRRQPTHLPGMPTRWEFVQRYCATRGLSMEPEEWVFYEVFGLFRLAVIAQQIHYRLFHGQTHNPAFRVMRPAVLYLDQRCQALIAGSGL